MPCIKNIINFMNGQWTICSFYGPLNEKKFNIERRSVRNSKNVALFPLQKGNCILVWFKVSLYVITNVYVCFPFVLISVLDHNCKKYVDAENFLHHWYLLVKKRFFIKLHKILRLLQFNDFCLLLEHFTVLATLIFTYLLHKICWF